jgi:hypothetical protein
VMVKLIAHRRLVSAFAGLRASIFVITGLVRVRRSRPHRAWGCSVSEDRLSTEVHAPYRGKWLFRASPGALTGSGIDLKTGFGWSS